MVGVGQNILFLALQQYKRTSYLAPRVQPGLEKHCYKVIRQWHPATSTKHHECRWCGTYQTVTSTI